ncbi:hypothetical protein CCR98_05615 [Stenotrophomonas sp. WZN-1]|uniref:NMCC_0638 family (lipo)protein n=1 Tax=Stenotrophomonas sp. WZN-1 TaxID=2005046 RepID=UPI000B4493E3|nr:hypothetical protein [Stenotrophomonas sp. WZN-1]ARZ73667.1 hypothetical protein CCR98_05615 [Stenotrophomonas sp. WZN-1]
MRPASWLILALLPALAVAQPARAPKAKAPAQDPFSELFDTACMQHIGAPVRLQSLMESNGLAPLQPAEAATLLQGQSGVAWMVPLASGRYAVSWADDGTCTVYAEKADAAVVQKGFARLVQAAPKPLQARSLPGRGPLSADQVAIQYGWATPGQAKLQARFRLVTRQSAEAGVQAMASVTPGEAMLEQSTPGP